MALPQAVTAQESIQPVTDRTGQVLPMRPLTRDMMTHGLELAGAEQSFDAIVYEVLSQFFAPGSFRIDVRLEVSFHEVRPPRQSHSAAQPEGAVLPGMPSPADEALIAAIQRNEQNALPWPKRMELKRIHVMVVADDGFRADELELMQHLVASAVKAEPRRGDRIHIVQEALLPRDPSAKLPTEVSTAQEEVSTATKEDAVLTTREVSARRPDLPAIILLISSALLIFVVIYLAVVLGKRYV